MYLQSIFRTNNRQTQTVKMSKNRQKTYFKDAYNKSLAIGKAL